MITADIWQFALQLAIVGAIWRMISVKLAGTPVGAAMSFIY